MDEYVAKEQRAKSLKIEGYHGDALHLRLELENLYEEHNVDFATQAKNLNQLTYLAVCVGNLNLAERAARKCVAISRSLPTSDQDIATHLMMLSMVLAENSKFNDAVVIGEEAIAVYERFLGEDSDFVRCRRMDIDRMRRRDRDRYIER